MGKDLSFSVSMHEEELSDGTRVFVVECIELGISDFGETLGEAINNLKAAIKLVLEEDPEKRRVLEKEEPSMITRIFL